MDRFALGMVGHLFLTTSQKNLFFAISQFRKAKDSDPAEEEDNYWNSYDVPEENNEPDEPVDTSIFKYGLAENSPDLSVYAAREVESESKETTLGIYGLWTGLYFYADETSTDGLMQFTLHHVDSPDGRSFQGEGTDGLDSFTIRGSTEPLEGSTGIKFVKTYNRLAFRGQRTSWLYQGSLDQDSGVINGHWGPENLNSVGGPFRVGRSPAFAYQFRYTKEEFKKSPARARWAFAGAVVLYQVRQKLWSWAYFKKRADNRKRFLELYRRRELTNLWYRPSDGLTREERAELTVIETSLSPADARCYRSLAQSALKMMCIHLCVRHLVAP